MVGLKQSHLLSKWTSRDNIALKGACMATRDQPVDNSRPGTCHDQRRSSRARASGELRFQLIHFYAHGRQADGPTLSVDGDAFCLKTKPLTDQMGPDDKFRVDRGVNIF